ncbi:hypothetical protein ACI3PF_20705, partial [Lactococcus lactis]
MSKSATPEATNGAETPVDGSPFGTGSSSRRRRFIRFGMYVGIVGLALVGTWFATRDSETSG